jgi:hypothetical protein
VVDLRLIFRIVPFDPQAPSGKRFLTYVQRFDIIPHLNAAVSGSRSLKGPYPDPISGLFALKRSKRSNGVLMGDVVPLDQIRTLVDLTPRFGKEAHRGLTKENSLSYSSEFWLNKYFNKELFLALS